jgi:hypothetical protein
MGWGRDAGGSAGFALVKEQLETWRSSKHKGSGRIPEELWEAAAGLCARQAPGTVAKRLGLSYKGLKSRVVERQSNEFIEVDMSVAGWRLECARGDGARLSASGSGAFPEGIIRQFLS